MKLYIWRHPKPKNVQGLCFGQSEVRVDARKIKRLANQINHYVKRHKLPKSIWVSPLSRCRLVGEQLQRLGFQYQVDPRLMETHFGIWENKPWDQISKAEIDHWCEDFANFAPEGGENLNELFVRASDWLQQRLEHQPSVNGSSVATDSSLLVVGHAGWISTVQMIAKGKGVPNQAEDWPRPLKHSSLTAVEVQ